jgi:hypothetical protein
VDNLREDKMPSMKLTASRKTQGVNHMGNVGFFYSCNDDRTWNAQYTPYDKEYIDRDYRRVDPDGRRYRIDNIQGPGGAAKGNPYYALHAGFSHAPRHENDVSGRSQRACASTARKAISYP